MNAHVAEMEQLGRRLWGEPNPRESTRDDIRFGKSGSKSIDRNKGVWFDHESNEGGGHAELYEKVHGHRPTDDGIVAVYDYHSATGALLFQVVRKVPKTFRQRRPDGNGGWIWHMHGVERVPYRLPELLHAAPHATIFIAEGEKDAEALRDHGLIATTNPGGAGKWAVTMSAHLQGRNVVILPDNDNAGRDHARQVAQSLRGHAAVVTVIDLPGLPEKGDVSDWLAAGGTAEELEKLVASAQADATPPGAMPNLRSFLAIEAWADRDMPQPDRLLGDLLTTTTRMFLVGRTGLGKTLLGFGLAAGIASGAGFLHWRSARAARVLYLDGEMPGELIRLRSIDALRRLTSPPPPGNLTIFSRDTEDEFARHFPTLGRMPPLNIEAGQNFIHALIAALGGIDVVIFDNVMSLITGDQKDEVPWSDTLPLVSSLTTKRIGQIWLDHTGHNTDRQYGSATKAWRFDTVGLMTPLPDDQRRPHEVAFGLSFEHPGKARRCTPDNARDFTPCTIRLRDDLWTSDLPEMPGMRPVKPNVSPTSLSYHRALLDALAISATPNSTTREAWFSECARVGLVPRSADSDSHAVRERKRAPFRKSMSSLKVAGWIGVDGETVWNLAGETTR